MSNNTKIKQDSFANVSAVVAKSEDGTVQISFTIPFSVIKKKKEEALEDLTKDITVSGFRKGKAPKEKVTAQIPENTLLETTLQKLLPSLFADAVTQHKIKAATYPKFEVVKATENSDWQIRATTCELPDIKLDDYKQLLLRSKSTKIWVPGKDDKKQKEPSREEKEQEIIKILLETININVPKVLIEEEVNSRLSNLLARIEKLGLSLEGYLASIGKTSESLRQEYEKQARETIALTLILNKIVAEEKLSVSQSEIDRILRASVKDEKDYQKLNTPEQRRLIEAMLSRRSALDYLTTLA